VKVASASVLICTYNRAHLLRETLAALRAMTLPADCRTEVIVIDNNSTDNTQAVIDEARRNWDVPVIGIREERQGKSFALNRGLEATTGDVVALTDDDVVPAQDWLKRIVDAFRARDVSFVFGKVLPRWGAVPPPELLTPPAQDIWGPLAIVDYGDEPAEYVPETMKQRLPIGANLAFARPVLQTIGGWRTDLGKVDNTLISGEDHEIFVRMRRFGLYRGYYDPEISVRHFVPPERLTRQYFRRWFFWHGKTQALMLDDVYPDVDFSRAPQFAGVPRFVYRQSVEQLWRWLSSLPTADALTVLTEELRALRYAGFFYECWRRRARFARRPGGLAQPESPRT